MCFVTASRINTSLNILSYFFFVNYHNKKYHDRISHYTFDFPYTKQPLTCHGVEDIQDKKIAPDQHCDKGQMSRITSWFYVCARLQGISNLFMGNICEYYTCIYCLSHASKRKRSYKLYHCARLWFLLSGYSWQIGPPMRWSQNCRRIL